MGVESSMSSKVLLRLVISVLTIISLDDWVASESLKDGLCEGGKCGDVIKDCYFWNDTKPCPNFQSECHEKPVFNLQPFGEYVVDYDNQTLRSSSEFERTGNACFAPIKLSPKPSSEFDTHVSRFEPPSFLKSNERPSYLAFLHYCGSFPNVDHLNPHSTFPSGGANCSYVALIVDIQEDLHLNLSVCQSHVIVPVELDRKDRDKPENVDSDDKLKDGIRLKWNLTSWESCVKCKESGGKCREPDGSFQCFCSGKAYPRTCKRGSVFVEFISNANAVFWYDIFAAGNNQARLKIGLGSGIGALASICLCLCIYMIRYKQHHSLKFRSRHASSESSLKADLEVGNVYFEVPIFTNGELEEATNYFDSARELGDGGFGTVYFGKLRDGREVAVKRLYGRNYWWVKQFMTEVQILTRLRHRNLVSLYGCTSQHSHELLLVYEYIPNGTVADHLHGERANQDPLLWPSRISIAVEMATALAYLHAFGVVLVELILSMPAVDISRDRHEINLANLATSKIRNRAFHELIDPNLGFESDPEINRMIMVVAELAFRCLQQDKDMRPSMGTVLEELKAILSGTHEPDKSKDVSDDNSAGQGKNPPPSPECDDVGLLKNMKSPTSPVSVTQKWGSSGSSSVHSG
ncbi:hypothetical protein NL676_037881 [Syzygium grande]|nr:hypothetical protein NL676_037881 [Syzygium grande]